MADILREVFGLFDKRYKDMGDGTHAEVLAIGAGGVELPATIVHGQNTVAAAGTAEALGPATALVSGVRVKALAGNAGDIYVGDADVDANNGFVLDAGEEVFVEVANLATLYIDTSDAGDGVSYIGN